MTTTDTFDVWLEDLKTIHSQEGDRCRADHRAYPCHMRRLIDKAEAAPAAPRYDILGRDMVAEGRKQKHFWFDQEMSR